MSGNIVILSGSPRKGGNTDILANAFKEGAESAGKSVSLFRVADMKIGGCLGCEHCFEETGVCFQKDDMPRILDALRKADALAVASPVYNFDVTAQVKLAIDRMYALFNEKTPIKRAALLMACADDTADTARGAAAMYETWLEFQKWEDAGILIVTGVHKPGEIAGRPELEKAKALGREI
ncbi:MAG: flavodoxin family protein [Defluviitaleaceae bacterium]|nr:flavodoxin family protein [Defluviitaleaceae bacterium]MCL2837146.1 flavodoxin family protein [Defluviitaleaceae bacterium]